MSVGLQPNTSDVNVTIGSAMRDVKLTLERIHALRAWYLGLVGGLQGAYGISADDDATFGSALADLDQLYDLFTGAATLSTAKDFRTFAKRLWGFGV
jgi:hypothetical protein